MRADCPTKRAVIPDAGEWAQQIITHEIARAVGGGTWRLIELASWESRSEIAFKLDYPITAPDGSKFDRVDVTIVVRQCET